jgi:hypothetical protein
LIVEIDIVMQKSVSSSNILMGRTCGTYGERRSAYRALEGKREGRRLLGRPRRSWEDNIKLDLREVEWGTWTGSIWLRIGTGGGVCKYGAQPLGFINWGEFLE